MNKIIEEARELGISLVGWVEVISSTYEGEIGMVRLLNTGEKLTISPVRNEYLLRSDRMAPAILSAPLEGCIFYGNDYAKHHGGWAPAPIGYGLSEWLTEAIAEVDKLWDKAYNDDLKGDYSSYHSGQKDAYDKCLDILKRFQAAPPKVKG